MSQHFSIRLCLTAVAQPHPGIMQGGEDDLDALLKQFEIQDRKAKEIVIVSNADSPTARLFASFTPVPGPVRKYILW